ncbi:MAG TPA: methionyl-tRNA formyltransferase [Candidatus Paceibacterota bacterium]
MIEIVNSKNPVLRKKAKAVPISHIKEAEIQKIINNMKSILKTQNDGIAIAAPQIGVSQRIFVVSGTVLKLADKKYKGDGNDLVFINPEIIKISKEKQEVEEGCLSVRWKYGYTKRAKKVSIKAYNEKGEKIERGASGVLAQVFQHEIDHLEGILFTDNAYDVRDMPPENMKANVGFFGTPEYAVMTLDKLYESGFNISFIVTSPDRPKGRNLILSPSPTKLWAKKHNIPVLEPVKLKDPEFEKELRKYNCDVFIVTAYGRIIPDNIINIPKAKTLNIHASLLPKYRGSCPIESAILADDNNTGVTIMRIDSDMDHGPVIAQKEVRLEPWPPRREALGKALVEVGNELLISILSDWVNGNIEEKEQDHSKATYTDKIVKEDGLINLDDDPYKNYLKIQAYHGWPGTYFFYKGIRVKIAEASWKEGMLFIEKVIPEGKKEMLYKDFLR